jgi:hypothetical protein
MKECFVGQPEGACAAGLEASPRPGFNRAGGGRGAARRRYAEHHDRNTWPRVSRRRRGAMPRSSYGRSSTRWRDVTGSRGSHPRMLTRCHLRPLLGRACGFPRRMPPHWSASQHTPSDDSRKPGRVRSSSVAWEAAGGSIDAMSTASCEPMSTVARRHHRRSGESGWNGGGGDPGIAVALSRLGLMNLGREPEAPWQSECQTSWYTERRGRFSEQERARRGRLAPPAVDRAETGISARWAVTGRYRLSHGDDASAH